MNNSKFKVTKYVATPSVTRYLGLLFLFIAVVAIVFQLQLPNWEYPVLTFGAFGLFGIFFVVLSYLNKKHWCSSPSSLAPMLLGVMLAFLITILSNLELYGLINLNILVLIFTTLTVLVCTGLLFQMSPNRDSGNASFLTQYWHVTLSLVILVGVFLRLAYVDHWAYFRDEYNILAQALINFNTGVYSYTQLWPLIEIHTLLYKVFGFTSDVLFNRIPYIAFYVLNSILLFLSMARLFSKQAALLTVSFFAITAFSIEMSLYVRHYEFYLMISLMLLTLLVYARHKRELILTALLYAMVMIHSFVMKDGFYVAGLLPALGYLYHFFKSDVRFYSLVEQASKQKWVLVMIGAFIAGSAWIVFSQVSWLLTIGFHPEWFTFLTTESLGTPYLQIALGSLALTWYATLFLSKKRGMRGTTAIVVFFVLILLLYTFAIKQYFAPRYIYYFFPLYLAIISIPLVSFTKPAMSRIIIVLTLCSVLISTVHYYDTSENYDEYIGTYNFDATQLADYINNNSNMIAAQQIITENTSELLYLNQTKLNCTRVFNTDFGYVAPCNAITFDEFSSSTLRQKGGEMLLITDWRRDPFFNAQPALKNISITRLELLLDSDYRVYRVLVE